MSLSEGLLLILLLAAGPAWGQGEVFKLGRAPTQDEVRAWDIAISPTGEELPVGKGLAGDGAQLFVQRCAACHGPEGTGGVAPRLVGRNTVTATWPFATSLWDYINRAMPLYQEGTLSSDEVYALTAYLLYKAEVIEQNDILNQDNLAAVEMPNRDGYVPPPLSQWEPGMPRLFKIIEP